MCPCREAEQTTQHILQDCRNHRLLREEIWPTPAPITRKAAWACGCAAEDHRFDLESRSPSLTSGERKEETPYTLFKSPVYHEASVVQCQAFQEVAVEGVEL